MNPAQGSPPSVVLGENSPEYRATGGMRTDELDLSSDRRCKTKSLGLPFSVESLISDRTRDTSPQSAECGPGCVGAEEIECASPKGHYRSKLEAVDLTDKEMSPWSQAPYASPSSECKMLCLPLFFLKHIFNSLTLFLKIFRELNTEWYFACKSTVFDYYNNAQLGGKTREGFPVQ